MTSDHLTALLAEHVMHWRVTPDRFLAGKRGWSPRWKFQPTRKLTDAIRLLEAAVPQEYSVATGPDGASWVKVKIAGVRAEARDKSKPLAICLAVAAALAIKVDSAGVEQ